MLNHRFREQSLFEDEHLVANRSKHITCHISCININQWVKPEINGPSDDYRKESRQPPLLYDLLAATREGRFVLVLPPARETRV